MGKKLCHKIPAEPEVLTEGMLLGDISRLFDARVRRETERAGFPQGYRRIVFHLSHNERLTLNELARLTHMKAPSISVQLQKMEQEKLITRKTDESDLRKSYVSLTEKGRECDSFFISNCEDTEKVMLGGFTAEEKELLKGYLKRIAENLITDMEENR